MATGAERSLPQRRKGAKKPPKTRQRFASLRLGGRNLLSKNSDKSLTSTQPSIGVFTTDTNLVIQVWDAALARLTGIGEQSAMGQAVTALLPDLEKRGLLNRFHRSLEDGVVEVLAPAFHHYLIPCAPVTPAKHFTNMQQRVTIAPLRDGDSIVSANSHRV